MKKYVFKPYSKIFPELFQKERERIASNINLGLVIEHVEVRHGIRAFLKNARMP